MKRFLIAVFLFGVATLFFLSCQKELSQESNTNNATFSLLDDSSNCISTPAVNGDYYNGVAARNVNFVTVVVNVKTTGNYSIATTNENGFYFADSGFFSSVGLDTLVLKMKGRPILIQSTDFSFSDSNTCSFLVDVLDSTGTGLGGVDTSGSTGSGSYSATYVDPNPASDNSWHFTDSTNNKSYGGSYLTKGVFTDNGDGTSSFQCQGFDKSNSNLALTISVEIQGTAIKTGSYKVDGLGTVLFMINVSDPLNFEYEADASTAQEATDPSYVNITSYDVSSGRVKGSFRCWAKDKSGNSALIEGSFNILI